MKFLQRAALAALAFSFALAACGSRTDTRARLLQDVSPKIVKLTPPSNKETGGTGFLVRAPSGTVYILTNFHICRAAEGETLEATNVKWQRPFRARVVERATETDLCILEAPQAFGGLEVYTGTDTSTYETVYAIGHPKLRPISLSEGHIISRGDIQMGWDSEDCKGPGRAFREFETWFGKREICIWTVPEAWDTTVRIHPGNSGSPLLNASGKVIGVMFAAEGDTNFGAAIAVDTVRAFLAFR